VAGAAHTDFDTIWAWADKAVYQAKASGGHSITYYEPEADAQVG
jgi:PleD family two-component response regulator